MPKEARITFVTTQDIKSRIKSAVALKNTSIREIGNKFLKKWLDRYEGKNK